MLIFTYSLGRIRPLRVVSAARRIILTQFEARSKGAGVRGERRDNLPRVGIKVDDTELRGSLAQLEACDDLPCEVVDLIVDHLSIEVAVILRGRVIPVAVSHGARAVEDDHDVGEECATHGCALSCAPCARARR